MRISKKRNSNLLQIVFPPSMEFTARTPPSLPKWPFLLSDAVLVMVALLVVFRGGGSLNTWQVLFCVFAVVVGALLFVAPYVYEFYLKQKSHEAAEVAAVDALLGRMNQAVREVSEMREAHRADTRKIAQILGTFEDLATILENQLDSLKEARSADSEGHGILLDRLDQLAGRPEIDAAALERRLDQLSDGLGELRERPDSVPGIAAGVDALESALKPLPSALQGLDQRLGQLEARIPEDPSAHWDQVREALAALEVHLASPATWPSLGGADPATVEVSPGPGASETGEVTANKMADEPDGIGETEVKSLEEDPADSVQVPGGVEEAPATQAPVDPEIQESRTLLPAERRMLEKALGSNPARSATSGMNKWIAAEPTNGPGASEAKRPAPPEPVEFDLGNIENPPKSAKNPVEGSSEGGTAPARITASILIGIGNKLYIRGVGPGLSEDRGVPLEFVEIGKFRWIADDASRPVKGRILLNDEIPARSGTFVIKPGEHLEISPEFPRP